MAKVRAVGALSLAGALYIISFLAWWNIKFEKITLRRIIKPGLKKEKVQRNKIVFIILSLC